MNDYLDWVRDRALPTWATAGFDMAAGRFRERLGWDGQPLDVPHRAMVQARQIYVYAHAAELGWHDGAALAERAMRTLIAQHGDEHGDQASFAFSVDARGAVVSAVRDAYTHAFVLFALAWLHRLTGDARLLERADQVLRFMDAEMTCRRHGGLFDTALAADPAKRQNPLMHLLEALLFLAQTAPDRGYLARADALVALFTAHLFKREPGVLLEHFAEDWAAHPAPAKAGLWEPGHHFEWVWLLAEHGRLAGVDHGATMDLLDRSAQRHGVRPSGLIVDEVALDGTVVKPSHRVWPHTEAIKAAVAQDARGVAGARGFAARMAGTLMTSFLDRPFAGGWIDHLDADRRPLVDYVPASSLYHLFLAAAEADRLTPAAAAARRPEPVAG